MRYSITDVTDNVNTSCIPRQEPNRARPNPIRARLDDALKERLDKYCEDEYRNQTQAVNILLTQALDAYDIARGALKDKDAS